MITFEFWFVYLQVYNISVLVDLEAIETNLNTFEALLEEQVAKTANALA